MASPEIMPIELVISIWKRLYTIEDQPNRDTLVFRVAKASRDITRENCSRCINYCRILLRKCLNEEHLFDY